MSNPFLPRCAPIWGFPPNWTPADLSPSYQDPAVIVNAVNGAQTSAAVALGARSVELLVSFSVAGSKCDISLISVTGAGDQTVKTWAGVDGSVALFAGNLEHVDLQGLPIKIAIANPVLNGGTVTIGAKVTS